MRAKSIVLICIALGCGLVASIGISQVIDSRSKKKDQAIETVKIFVAAKNIDLTEPFGEKNVRLEAWPKHNVPEGAIQDLKQLKGRYARARLYAGEPINKSKMMGVGGGIAQVIPPGYRVCTIKVNMVSSISNLIKPGDRVDIVCFLRANQEIRETATKLVLEAVRIFAVNAQTQRFVDERGKTIEAKTVSVLVKNSQVARLMMASELGTLRLTLRGYQVTKEEEGIAEVYNVRSFMGDKSEVADDKKKKGEGGSDRPSLTGATDDFSKFLKANQKNPEPKVTVVAPVLPKVNLDVFEMEILGPQGGRKFQFDKKTGKLIKSEKAPAGVVELTGQKPEDRVDSDASGDDDNKDGKAEADANPESPDSVDAD